MCTNTHIRIYMYMYNIIRKFNLIDILFDVIDISEIIFRTFWCMDIYCFTGFIEGLIV